MFSLTQIKAQRLAPVLEWSLPLFSLAPKVPDHTLSALITDFFDWLEFEWQLPVPTPETIREPLPVPPDLSTEGPYTVRDLMSLYGLSAHQVHNRLSSYQLSPASYTSNPRGMGWPQGLYEKQALLPILKKWVWVWTMHAVNIWWQRFFRLHVEPAPDVRDGLISLEDNNCAVQKVQAWVGYAPPLPPSYRRYVMRAVLRHGGMSILQPLKEKGRATLGGSCSFIYLIVDCCTSRMMS